ncbi:MAG: DUF1700 domain-containing protein [Clostridia bacterium]|nr:DUF1700 domain-containing protein [Clostridia bacterium]
MTYIKWKDEVESYLINLSDAEKQKILSYFSEMYADKRDAGKSEAQIIEEFGAPYDVAKRILADSISAASQQDNSDGAGASVNGGNNYNYNYYNYNYGGAPAPNAPAPNAPPPPAKETPQKEFVAPAQQPAAIAQPAATQVKKKAGAGRIILGVFLAFLLGCLTISLIGSALAMIVESFISIGATAGAIAAAECGGAEGTAIIGYSIMIAGLNFILLAPIYTLCRFLWRKLTKFLKGA